VSYRPSSIAILFMVLVIVMLEVIWQTTRYLTGLQ
jgi:hypothetical protein